MESLNALVDDTKLCDLIGHEIIKTYVALKRGEIEMIKDWTKDKRRNYLIDRY